MNLVLLAAPIAGRLHTALRIGLVGLACALATALPAAAAGPLASAAARAAAPEPGQRLFERALQLHREHRHAGAYGRLAQLADQGHPGAAHIAWVMAVHGQALYGSDFDATPEQLQHWREIAQAQPATSMAAPAATPVLAARRR